MTVQQLIDLLSKLPEPMRQLPIKLAYEKEEFLTDVEGDYELVMEDLFPESIRYCCERNAVCITAENAIYEFNPMVCA